MTQGPQVARAAAVKAKKDAVSHLKAILQEIQGMNAVLEKELEGKKEEARHIKSSISPLGSRLDEVQQIAEAWSTRRDAK